MAMESFKEAQHWQTRRRMLRLSRVIIMMAIPARTGLPRPALLPADIPMSLTP